jgi:hypothetical protein
MEVLRIGASSFPPCEAVGSVATCDVAVLEDEPLSDGKVNDTRRSSNWSILMVDECCAAQDAELVGCLDKSSARLGVGVALRC